MVQSYSDNKYIYSVDLMFAYINNHKMKVHKMKLDEQLLKNLTYNSWGDPVKNILYSPRDVIMNPKKYKHEYKRIGNANLKYPIIMNSKGFVIDGVHRLSKAYIEDKKTINAYVFDNTLMKKFIIAKNKEWSKVDKMQPYDFVQLYINRFTK